MKPVSAAILVAAILGFGALFYYQIQTQGASSASCPGHWHSTFALVLDGKAVSYNHPALFIETSQNYGNSMPLRDHVHTGSPGLMHFEPPGSNPLCIPLQDMMEYLGTSVSDSKVVLSGPGHDALHQSGTFAVNATHPLRILTRESKADPWVNWTGSVSSFMARQAPDGEKILFAVGNYSEAQLQTAESHVPSLPAGYPQWA
jgi:hypothetical protein